MFLFLSRNIRITDGDLTWVTFRLVENNCKYSFNISMPPIEFSYTENLHNLFHNTLSFWRLAIFVLYFTASMLNPVGPVPCTKE